MKYLKLSPEYQCSPLWVSSSGDFYENLSIDASPFNEQLKKKILDWAINFEGTLNQDYPPDSGFATLADEEAFEQKGIEIWEDILSNYSNQYREVLFKSYTLSSLYSNLADYIKDSQVSNKRLSQK